MLTQEAAALFTHPTRKQQVLFPEEVSGKGP